MYKHQRQFDSIFSSKTVLTKERFKSLQKILQSLFQHPACDQFRYPLQYKERGLINYEAIIQTPRDISTVQKLLKTNYFFQSCEQCLDQTQTIFQNSFLYNKKTEWIINLTRRCEQVFHKLVRNYLPEVKFKSTFINKKDLKKNKIEQKQRPTQKIETHQLYINLNSESQTFNQENTEDASTQIFSGKQKQRLGEINPHQELQHLRDFFELVKEAPQKSLEVLYIMVKNQDLRAISTDRNGNCSIDVKKLSKSFILKSTLFLKDQIERNKSAVKDKKNTKHKHFVDRSRYEI